VAWDGEGLRVISDPVPNERLSPVPGAMVLVGATLDVPTEEELSAIARKRAVGLRRHVKVAFR